MSYVGPSGLAPLGAQNRPIVAGDVVLSPPPSQQQQAATTARRLGRREATAAPQQGM